MARLAGSDPTIPRKDLPHPRRPSYSASQQSLASPVQGSGYLPNQTITQLPVQQPPTTIPSDFLTTISNDYRPTSHPFANPAPLGLCAFALTTFVLSLVNLGASGVTAPNIVVPLAFGYGGLVQLLAGMWEMAVGNTFGATALSSYGAFWIAYGILLTPTWNILGEGGPYASADSGELTTAGNAAVGFFLIGWWIFTTVLLLCTLRSTLAFFLLFSALDLTFLMLACAEFALDGGAKAAAHGLTVSGGVFGMLAALLAWYNALAGLADSSNSFYSIPVFHFPWSAKGREAKLHNKSERATV